jgi:uncharacterized protein (DUF302 family)
MPDISGSLLYMRESADDPATVGRRLEAAVSARGFGVVGVVDLGARMREKGIEFARTCRIYEVCAPLKAKAILDRDMRVSTALPCRISLYEEGGRVILATLLPTLTLALFNIPGMDGVAAEVEREIKGMMDDAAGDPLPRGEIVINDLP